jgi:hypothetical protein
MLAKKGSQNAMVILKNAIDTFGGQPMLPIDSVMKLIATKIGTEFLVYSTFERRATFFTVAKVWLY